MATIYEKVSRKRFDAAKHLHISYRTLPGLDSLIIFLSKEKDAAGIRLKGLFKTLNVSEGEKERIFDNRTLAGKRRWYYNGGYRADGKQRLADLLGKEIQFHRGYGAALCAFDKYEKKEIYKPRKIGYS